MGGFREKYELAVKNLLGELPPGCEISEVGLSRAEEHIGVRLPLALRDFYLAIGGLDQFNQSHDRLLAPKDWFVDDGKLVFLVENQAVLYWGVKACVAQEDDPPVFQGLNNLPKLIEWSLEHDAISEFLLVLLHWQAVCGGFEWIGIADIQSHLLTHFEEKWQYVGQVNNLRAFRRNDQAACLIGEGDNQELFIGASSEEIFQTITADLENVGVGLSQV